MKRYLTQSFSFATYSVRRYGMCPLHLQFFNHPFGHDFVNRRFHKSGGNGFSIPPLLTIIRDQILVISNVGVGG